MATIHDVARRAGVSAATVSRVVSGRGYVGDKTRVRVQQAVAELGYVPNAMARGLKTRRSGLIALVIPEIVNSFYTTVVRGVEDVANNAGLQVIVGNTDEKLEKEASYVQLMVETRVEGMIIASAGRTARHFQPLVLEHVPAVLIDRAVDGFEADIVRGDNLGGAVELTGHLLSLGHSCIAFINGDPETSVARERETGFRQAMAGAGVAVDERLMSAGSWFIEDAEARVGKLLDSGLAFTAMFAANNFMAIGALRALRQRGLSVPSAVALACFDDVEVAAEIDPFLTVMAQPAYTLGTLAMRLLLERIGGTYLGPTRDVVLSPRLLVRRSCGSRPTEATAVKPGSTARMVPVAVSASIP